MVIKDKILREAHSLAVESTSLEDQVYALIKSAILNRELRPGEKVSHTDWAERLHISRTPVRDALKRLENEGLIIRETERIWHVYTLTLDDVYKIFEARVATDTHIASLAALNITPQQIVEIEGLLAEMELTHRANNYDAFNKVNSRFHDLLNRASKNAYLVQVNLLLHEKTTRLYPKGINIDHRLEKGLAENQKIAQAIIARDPELAAKYQEEHVRSYCAHLVKVIKEIVIPYTGPEF